MSEEHSESTVEMIAEFFRRAMSFGRETVSVLEDEAELLIGRLVEKGELTEEEARRLVLGTVEKLRRDRDHFLSTLDARFRARLQHLRLPSREEIDELKARIEALTTRVDALLAERRGEG
jgi:polyhydroxyalkanoate synthesis regulator phasin